jgi:hypothetical protein
VTYQRKDGNARENPSRTPSGPCCTVRRLALHTIARSTKMGGLELSRMEKLSRRHHPELLKSEKEDRAEVGELPAGLAHEDRRMPTLMRI